MAQSEKEPLFLHEAMIPLIIKFMFDKIIVTFAFALYFSIKFNEDAKLLLHLLMLSFLQN